MQWYRNLAFLYYGSTNFSQEAFLKHAKAFDPKDMEVDMSGKNVVITGANAGLGKNAAVGLASRGATVYALCRNADRGKAAVEEIRQVSNNPNVHLEILDVSSLEAIRKYADGYNKSGRALHVLMNNAGAMVQSREQSADGLELNFATNLGGVVALTLQLLPALEKAAPDARVITVATGGIYTETVDADLQMKDVKKMDGTVAYARNKRIQVAVTEKWADLYGSKGIGFYTVHPGWADTTTLEHAMPGFHKTFKKILRTPEQGSDTMVWLSMQPMDRLTQGAFYFDRKEVTKHLTGARTQYTKKQVDETYAEILKLIKMQDYAQ